MDEQAKISREPLGPKFTSFKRWTTLLLPCLLVIIEMVVHYVAVNPRAPFFPPETYVFWLGVGVTGNIVEKVFRNPKRERG